MKTLHSIANACEYAMPLVMLSPVAFPLVALFDGAQAAYLSIGFIALFLSAFAACAIAFVLSLPGQLAHHLEMRAIERAAFQRYLLNGGRI